MQTAGRPAAGQTQRASHAERDSTRIITSPAKPPPRTVPDAEISSRVSAILAKDPRERIKGLARIVSPAAPVAFFRPLPRPADPPPPQSPQGTRRRSEYAYAGLAGVVAMGPRLDTQVARPPDDHLGEGTERDAGWA